MTTIEQAKQVEQRLRKCAVTEISPWEAADTIFSLCAELEAAKKDAARYRWLCEVTKWSEDIFNAIDTCNKEKVDAAVDAAIAAAEQAPQPTELTDDEIKDLWSEAHDDTSPQMPYQTFARAVLAAQKAKS